MKDTYIMGLLTTDNCYFNILISLDTMREKLGSCCEKVLINLFHSLQTLDVTSNGLLSRDLYIQQLNKFRLPIEEKVRISFRRNVI